MVMPKRNVTPQDKAAARLRIGQPVGIVAPAVGLTVAEVQAIADAMPVPSWRKELDAAQLPQYEKCHLQKSALMVADQGCELSIKPVEPVGRVKPLGELADEYNNAAVTPWEHGFSVADAEGNVERVPLDPGAGMPWDAAPWEDNTPILPDEPMKRPYHTNAAGVKIEGAALQESEALPWD
jgi:hypothetical protein